MTMGPGGAPYGGPQVARQAGRLPLLLSGLALLTALLAAGVSLVALARSGEPAGRSVAGATSTPTVEPVTEPPPTDGTEQSTDPTATTDPSPEPTSEATDGPDPRGVYSAAYQQEKLRLQPSQQRRIDLDLPTANAGSGASDLLYSGFAPNYKLLFGEVSLAEIKSPNPTANDCAVELRRAPIDAAVAPSKGKLLCVLTSAERASDQGIPQKVVLMRVDAIAADGTLNLTVSAWNVPK